MYTDVVMLNGYSNCRSYKILTEAHDVELFDFNPVSGIR